MKKGFTLVELLVVIAIIGILASIVLGNLSSSRNKARDAAVKGQLKSALLQAEIYKEYNNDSYDEVCVSSDFKALTDGASLSYGGQDNADVCNDEASAYDAYVPLKAPSSGKTGWCIDSEGTSEETTEIVAGGATACP